jgi:hypothetical protein
MEGVTTKPKTKTRRAARKTAAAGKARARKRPAAKRRKRPRPEPVPPPGSDVPYWIPRDSGWTALSETTRQAVTQILAPAYRQLVLEAQGEVERSVGITLVHLMWLEICGQIPLAPAVADPWSAVVLTGDPEVMVTRHLHLVAAKCQSAELLSKVRMVGEVLRRGAVAAAALPYLPAPHPQPVVTVPAQPGPRAEIIPWLPGDCPDFRGHDAKRGRENGTVPLSPDKESGEEQAIGKSQKR